MNNFSLLCYQNLVLRPSRIKLGVCLNQLQIWTLHISPSPLTLNIKWFIVSLSKSSQTFAVQHPHSSWFIHLYQLLSPNKSYNLWELLAIASLLCVFMTKNHLETPHWQISDYMLLELSAWPWTWWAEASSVHTIFSTLYICVCSVFGCVCMCLWVDGRWTVSYMLI